MAQWVGIDIGTNAIKVAVLKTAYRKVSLVGLATVLTANYGTSDDALVDVLRVAIVGTGARVRAGTANVRRRDARRAGRSRGHVACF